MWYLTKVLALAKTLRSAVAYGIWRWTGPLAGENVVDAAEARIYSGFCPPPRLDRMEKGGGKAPEENILLFKTHLLGGARYSQSGSGTIYLDNLFGTKPLPFETELELGNKPFPDAEYTVHPASEGHNFLVVASLPEPGSTTVGVIVGAGY